jgi:hypothetical protein
MEKLEIVEIKEKFSGGGATQCFTYSGVNWIMDVLSRLGANPESEYTFICLDESKNYCFHSIDSIRGAELSAGGNKVSL